jgi:glycerol uptake facilitator-like aquaporin
MYKRILSEFVSTLFFVFVFLSTNNYLAIGISLALVIFLFDVTTNPSVSIIFYLMGKLQQNELFAVIIAQILAAFTALQLIKYSK